MDKLVKLIKQVEDSDIPEQQFLSNEDHPLVPQIVVMLDELFITEGGHIDFDAKDKFMAEYGYELYPVEHDRWGWILGGLITEKGVIVFG